MLEFKGMLCDVIWYELVGLFDRLKKIVIFIDVVDDEEYVDEVIL